MFIIDHKEGSYNPTYLIWKQLPLPIALSYLTQPQNVVYRAFYSLVKIDVYISYLDYSE